MRIFLGGTCNGSTWREGLIPLLESANIDYFNPVVDDWTPECQKEEYRQKEHECDVHLYVITKEMTGFFSIAEAVDSAHRDGVECVFHVFPDGFSESQVKSFKAICGLIGKIGGYSAVDESTKLLILRLKELKNK